jgi:hypothetical protein
MMGKARETFQSVARSGQKSIAQGLPWVDPPTGISPEGATRYGETVSGLLNRITDAF